MSNASANFLQTGIVQLREATEAVKVRIRTPQKLRNLELFLLIIAWIIALAAITLVQLGTIENDQLEALDLNLMVIAGSLAVGTLIFHIVLRFVAREADPFMLPIVTALNGLGIAMIYRIDIANEDFGWESASLRQIVWTIIGIGIGIVVVFALRNYRVLARYRYIAMFLAIGLLLLPLVPGLGVELNGARVWINIGPASFQPGEIAKIALAIFFAGYLMTARDSLSVVGRKFLGISFPRVRDLGPLLVIWAACLGVLAFQRDLGTSMLYFGLFVVMVYVATGKRSWVFLGAVLVAIGGVFAYSTMGYVRNRIHAWLFAFDDSVFNADGGSWQIVQGIFGMASGGLIGTGLGEGRPDIVFAANSDYIMSSLGEELGLAGILAILCLYLLLVSRGIRIGHYATDDFAKLLASSLSFVIALQVFIVVGGITRIIPLTGLTTPFLAAGGSSLLANWIIVAILLRLSDATRMQSRAVITT